MLENFHKNKKKWNVNIKSILKEEKRVALDNYSGLGKGSGFPDSQESHACRGGQRVIHSDTVITFDNDEI